MINQKIRYSIINDYILKNTKQSICEVGSGSQGLGQYFKKIRFTGVDMDFADYLNKEIQTAPNMKAIKTNARNLPFKNNSFDLVFSLDMMEHTKPSERSIIINELLRISKDMIIVGFPCGENAHTMDRMHFTFLKNLHQTIPGWLIEHLSLPYPKEKEVDIILKKTDTTYFTFKQEGFLLHFIVHIFEFLTIGSSKFDRFVPFFILKNLSFQGNKFYRKIYVIKKN